MINTEYLERCLETLVLHKKKPFLLKNGYQTWGGVMKNLAFFISCNIHYGKQISKL